MFVSWKNWRYQKDISKLTDLKQVCEKDYWSSRLSRALNRISHNVAINKILSAQNYFSPTRLMINDGNHLSRTMDMWWKFFFRNNPNDWQILVDWPNKLWGILGISSWTISKKIFICPFNLDPRKLFEGYPVKSTLYFQGGKSPWDFLGWQSEKILGFVR